MLSKNINGLAVVHIDAGQRLGTVRGILLDPAKRRATALLVALAQGWMRKGLLPIEHVYAIGDQAVTVEEEAHIVTPDEDSALWASWKDRVDLHGMPILTERGEGVGIVDAYDFDLNGHITEIAIRQGVWKRFKGQALTLPGTAIRSFGRDAVIVRAEFAADVQEKQTDAKPSRAGSDVAEALEGVAEGQSAGGDVEADASLPVRLWQRVRQFGTSKSVERQPAAGALEPTENASDALSDDKPPRSSEAERQHGGLPTA